MGDRHRWRFKFFGGVDSLLRVCYSARIHDGMIGRDDLAFVTDVHGGVLAGGVALTFAGPQHACLSVPLFWGFDGVPLNHLADGLVS